MMHAHPRRVAALVFTASVFALAGCRSVADPTRYYVLSPTQVLDPTPATAVSSAAIGVGPVLIPGYLDRAQIVTRGADDEFDLSQYHRWAEPLDRGIAQVVADNLASQLGSERIAVFPWRGGVARSRLPGGRRGTAIRWLTRPPGHARRAVAPSRQEWPGVGAEAILHRRAHRRRLLPGARPGNERGACPVRTRDRHADPVTSRHTRKGGMTMKDQRG